MRLKELLWRIAKMMETLNVPYMIIGGQSVAAYGGPRSPRNEVYINASNIRTDEVPANADGWGRLRNKEELK